MDRHFIGHWALGMAFGVAAGAVACAPRSDSGGCAEDLDCARGDYCDTTARQCVAADLDTTATESPAEATFTDKIVPFHRGEICLPMEVQSGAGMPVLMRPCVHPCLAVSSFEFRHDFECVGSSCDALALMWMIASSDGTAGCPADAFGAFDQSQCVYDTEVEFTLATETSNGPIRGSMRLEVPFLSNADMAQIAANPEDHDTIEQLVHQYPEDDGRVPDGRSISILSSHPAPPTSCRDGACPCFPIGF
ncbi:MAG: hypothetical protein KDK70_02280 [Myxococcales bacterium]|nr:hypothetical protein [Myxococcales bacterium]